MLHTFFHLPIVICSSSKSNSLNFYRHTLGKLLDSDAAASGLVREVLLIGGVHLGEIGHVSKEDSSLV